jgi:ubiquinone/menaquinone biosynthesis C-methylase UbiE
MTNTKLISDFYENYSEEERLHRRVGLLEKIRMKEIISRFLCTEDLNIADIGGGPGEYSIWLKKLGHKVSLIDLSPKHIEIAEKRSMREGVELDYVATGNALDTKLQSDTFDIVLILGPLYHLLSRDERILCIKEGHRILKTGGILLCSAISRYASLMYGYRYKTIDDIDFQLIVEKDLSTGIHQNLTDKEYFTDSYFHRIDELKDEVLNSGLKVLNTIGIEGPFWWFDDIENYCNNRSNLEIMLRYIKKVESENDIIGASNHLLVIAKKE